MVNAGWAGVSVSMWGGGFAGRRVGVAGSVRARACVRVCLLSVRFGSVRFVAVRVCLWFFT